MASAEPAQALPAPQPQAAVVNVPPPDNTQNIVLPPHGAVEVVTQAAPVKYLNPCCGLGPTLGCCLGSLAFFIIFVTIAGVLGQGQDTFCNGYWRADPRYQLGGHSAVAVWAWIQGCTFILLGLLLVLENLASTRGCLGTRDQLRTLTLWTVLFFIAWAICGNVWIIGDEGAFGVVPQACKDGNMGNRNLYHFCLAILIFLDIAIPLTLLAVMGLTRDSKGNPYSKTLMGTSTPNPVGVVPAYAVHNPTDDPNANACCAPSIAGPCLGLGLAFFIIFVTTAGVLGQSEKAFCDGYWKASPNYQLGKHSLVAVWALLQGSAILFLGFLWFLENRAAANRAWSVRDGLRTMILLTTLFNIGWLVCGNTWIIGPEGNNGAIPQACKDGNMGNRNLYHFCLAMLIFFDIVVPIALLAAALSTLDTTRRTCLNRTLGYSQPNLTAAPPPGDVKAVVYRPALPACCSLPVSILNLGFCLSLFAVFITVPSVLEPGKMIHPWDQTFCNRYWMDTATYPGAMLAGHSTIAVWSLIMGSCFFLLGLLWLLENRAAAGLARGTRDVLRTFLLLTALFSIAWMIVGNIWIISDWNNRGVIPQACKDGNMGNRNLYHFVYAMIIFLDIMVPLALLAVAGRTGLNKTLACVDSRPEAVPQQEIIKEAVPVIEKPAPSLLIGQA